MKKLIILLVCIVFFVMLLPVFPISKVLSYSFQYKFSSSVTSIFSDSNIIFVGTKSGLYFSNNSGKSFVEKNTGLSDLYITGITESAGNYFIGTFESGLYYGSVDNNKWTSLSDKVDCPTISSISSSENVIYVASHCTGFHVSFNNGLNWLDVNSGLPTQKTTVFLKTSSDEYFLGTEDAGLYYSDTLDEHTVWKSLLPGYDITSLGYINSKLIVDTSVGLFVQSGDGKFQKLNFIGGEPIITSIVSNSDRLIVGIQNFGLFATVDGTNYFEISEGQIPLPRSLFFNVNSNILYSGDDNGNLSYIDLSKPLLVSNTKIDLGVVNAGSALTGNFSVINIGYGMLTGTISAANFIKLSNNNFTNSQNISFVVDTSQLSPDTYTLPVTLTSNAGTKIIYISFKVLKIAELTLILIIDSKTAYINGEKVGLDAPPFIDKSASRTLVPLRFISQAFGANVEWDNSSRKVTIKKAATDSDPAILIELWIGKKSANVNLKNVLLDVAPVIVPPGRTMVPIRFISESFGSTVTWDGVARRITITYKP